MGIPVAGATYPILAFFVLGLYGSNAFILLAVTILGIGHIGIHIQHRNEAVGKKKRKLPVRILKAFGVVIGSAVVLFLIVYFGIKNVKFLKAFAGASNPVYEDAKMEGNITTNFQQGQQNFSINTKIFFKNFYFL